MLVPKSKKYTINQSILDVFEYDLPTKNLSLAKARINGRYPESGMSTNTKCEQAYYCLTGEAIIYSEKGDFEIKKGDTYYFKKQEKYYIEAKNLEVLIFNSPKWTKPQYKLNLD